MVDRPTPDARAQTGLNNQDVIVAVNGTREPMTVGALTAYVFNNTRPGSKIRLTVLKPTDRLIPREREVEFIVK